MNTDAQRFHKVVVGGALAVVVAISAGTLAMRATQLGATQPEAAPALPNPDVADAAASQLPSAADLLQPRTMDLPAPVESAPAPSVLTPTPTPAPASPSHARRDTQTREIPQQRTRIRVAAAAPAVPATKAVPDAIANETVTMPATIVAASSPTESAGGMGDVRDITAAPAAQTAPTAPTAPGSAESPASDDSITAAVKSQIAADPQAQGAQISVTTVQGVVVLSGTAPTPDVMEQVKAAVARVKDVKGVDTSTVTISPAGG